MGDNARVFSILSLICGLVGVFFIGIIAGITAIVFASVAFEKYEDESKESVIGLVLGLVDICIMGLIIIGVILAAINSGHLYIPLIGFMFAFGPFGFLTMISGGIPLPIIMY